MCQIIDRQLCEIVRQSLDEVAFQQAELFSCCLNRSISAVECAVLNFVAFYGFFEALIELRELKKKNCLRTVYNQ